MNKILLPFYPEYRLWFFGKPWSNACNPCHPGTEGPCGTFSGIRPNPLQGICPKAPAHMFPGGKGAGNSDPQPMPFSDDTLDNLESFAFRSGHGRELCIAVACQCPDTATGVPLLPLSKDLFFYHT